MKIVLFFLSLFSINSFAKECQLAANSLSAQYQVTKQVSPAANELEPTHTSDIIELHRNEKRVIQRFDHAGVSHVWSKMHNNRISLVRVFEQYQHAIEYQPNELNQKPNWDHINQLLPVPNISNMELVAKAGGGCQLTEKYRLTSGGKSYQLSWLPALALVSYFEIKTSKVTKQWKLISFEESSARSASLYTQYMNYSSTDYADIGDNESNPFLAKMIHQGFMASKPVSTELHSHHH